MNRLLLQFAAWLELSGYSPNSLQSYRLDVKRFIAWMANTKKIHPPDLKLLTHADLHNYLMTLSQMLKPRSVNRHLSSLRLFFHFLQQHGLISDNPSLRLQIPALPPMPAPPLPEEQLNLLLTASNPDTPQGLRDAVMLELLYHYGLKLNELTSINTADLLLKTSALQIRGRRARTLVLSEQSCKLLTLYLRTAHPKMIKNRPAPWLFPSRSGKRLDRIGVWRLINRRAARVGLTQHFTPRSLRHALAIQLLKNGRELKSVKKLLGYQRNEGMAIYAHITPKNSPSADR